MPGRPDSRSLRSGFLRSCERHPERIALEVAGEQLSYRDLRDRAAALAATLERHDPRPTPAQGAAAAESAAGAPPALTAVFGHRSSATFAGILGALLRG